jgi:hypothetical protein
MVAYKAVQKQLENLLICQLTNENAMITINEKKGTITLTMQGTTGDYVALLKTLTNSLQYATLAEDKAVLCQLLTAALPQENQVAL